MSHSPRSRQPLRGGIILMDSSSGKIVRSIALQYNPESLTRSLQPQWYEPAQGDFLVNRHRLTGPPVETFKLDAEIDAADQLERPEEHENTVRYGIQPQLSSLETIIYPSADTLESNNNLQAAGTLEIVPMEAPLSLFVWSQSRVVPVRITDFSITEEFFDTQLNPIRAKVSIGMRVLSANDLSFRHRGAAIYMQYQRKKEELAGLVTSVDFPGVNL